jgi:predicted GH43/DUF377 family glycosyl hydrolase
MQKPFIKNQDMFPILKNDPTESFFCPVLNQEVKWQESYVFNPAAIVKDSKVYLLFRGEDLIGKYGGTSRIGIAESNDGFNFIKRPMPILYPDNDAFLEIEKDGGVEDPRVVESDDGTFVMMYTAFNGHMARLCVATSKDLITWQKHGLAFSKAKNGSYKNLWSKSGSIITRQEGSHFIATKINGKYWMYWGETDIYLATSDNLIDWEPILKEVKSGKYFTTYLGNGQYKEEYSPPQITFKTALTIRNGRFDSRLVEPGPQAILTDNGIFFIYNASNDLNKGDQNLYDGEYTIGQALFDVKDPSSVIRRCENFFLRAESIDEATGQLNNAAFTEGLVYFNNKWLLYYVMSEAKIGVAICDLQL